MNPNLRSSELLKGQQGLIGCELGVLAGVHAHHLLSNLDIKRLYLIDSYDFDGLYWDMTALQFKERSKSHLAPWEDKLNWLYMKSQDVTNEISEGELDFVYIDGDHCYEAVKRDIEIFYEKVKSGGLISGHDFGMPTRSNGVVQAVIEFCKPRGISFSVAPHIGDWWFIKEDKR